MAIKFSAPKGTRDFPPGTLGVRNKIIKEIEDIFSLYGYEMWDGPAFEYLETLTAKSGEEIQKEIYTFQDKAERDLGLRFELTTTIARLIAGSADLKKPVKGYSYGKVWRYENTQQGRYREFLQMDADIFGSDHTVCEAELLDMAQNVLSRLGFADYYVKLNSRKVLNGIVRCCRIAEDKKQNVFRAVDKLDKIGKDGVLKEFLSRGLTEEEFDRIMSFISITGTNEEKLQKMRDFFADDEDGLKGLQELEEIISYFQDSSLSERIQIDYTLIRGFDYYTGPIYEIKIVNGEQVGSISGGGRYDKLIEVFGGAPTPAVGISFGIERLIDLIQNDPERAAKFKADRPSVFVLYMDAQLIGKAYAITNQFRQAGIPADLDLTIRSFRKQMQYADKKEYGYVVLVGEDEIARGEYVLKNMKTGEQEILRLDAMMHKLRA